MEKKLSSKQLNVLICQINPTYKGKQDNLTRISKSLEIYSSTHKLDLVMFPEMAFIGYNFKNSEDIFPYTEKCEEGQSFEFCSDLAKRLNSYVIFGYAERVPSSNNNYTLYNSVCLVDRSGKMNLNTRKTHMYCSDQLWCQPGDGFKTVTIYNLNNQPIKCTIGICMDINPDKFISGKYQLADFIINTKSQVLLFLSAWNDCDPNNVNQHQSQMRLINYWVNRLLPIMSKQRQISQFLVLVCDRTGQQITYSQKSASKTKFVGTSCVVGINPCQLIAKVSKRKQQYLLIKTEVKGQL